MNYPLFPSYQGAVIGKGFVADISARGRILASLDAEGWWLYGVNPGAVAADGHSLEDAHAQIRETLRLVFIDFAEEAQSFDEFKARVTLFFDETGDDAVEDWKAAVEAIRGSGGANIGLPRAPAESSVFIVVSEIAQAELTPALNVPAMNMPAVKEREHDPPLTLAQAA